MNHIKTQGQDYVHVIIMAKVSELLMQNMQRCSFPKEFDKWTSENKEIYVEYAMQKSLTNRHQEIKKTRLSHHFLLTFSLIKELGKPLFSFFIEKRGFFDSDLDLVNWWLLGDVGCGVVVNAWCLRSGILLKGVVGGEY